jgi:hypothetical protein
MPLGVFPLDVLKSPPMIALAVTDNRSRLLNNEVE